MSVLEEILAKKKAEVQERKALYSQKLLEQSIFFENRIVSLKKYLLREDKSGIIAEIKRKSPSKGVINQNVSIERISIGYMQAGASALSVLTDQTFFGGSNEDLKVARKFNFCPILRKDFIIDEYQIVEAKAIGADAILLIAAALTEREMKDLAAFAKSLGLETLMEVHNEEELEKGLNENIDLVGVNNRDLSTFEVSLNTSFELASKIPGSFIKVSESGISSPSQIVELKEAGFDGFLIGQNFMEQSRPERACAEFIEELSRLDRRAYAKS
ncbi:indole-3-glycerol phosphate synthase TrpC [Fulvivirga sedimenti]|uniref:Indole-3-glycerol phosphate synthase n=1 Tax=Fulvivirga sedimenti TaxID=2879465 RepID=A0A9X1KVB8_9BACT|nr:indole-3-glycerol phosphate synthase TrpC [Fulvivirga sedimenti]MCA6073580.1 indole-3-glycerol phosphate synthase TrpC [Fulvivirga sedimenti]